MDGNAENVGCESCHCEVNCSVNVSLVEPGMFCLVVCTSIVYMVDDCVEIPPTNVTCGMGVLGSLLTLWWCNCTAWLSSDRIYEDSRDSSCTCGTAR